MATLLIDKVINRNAPLLIFTCHLLFLNTHKVSVSLPFYSERRIHCLPGSSDGPLCLHLICRKEKDFGPRQVLPWRPRWDRWVRGSSNIFPWPPSAEMGWFLNCRHLEGMFCSPLHFPIRLINFLQRDEPFRFVITLKHIWTNESYKQKTALQPQIVI